MSSISKLWRKLRDKEYRGGYTESQHSVEVPFQIRAIRKARGWTQAQLAERCGIPQARISHIEQPGRDPLSLRTLYRLAAAFDVGLLVQFVSFSELVRREADFEPETFCVPSFAEDHVEKAGQTTDATRELYTTVQVASAESGLVRDAALQVCNADHVEIEFSSFDFRMLFSEVAEDENGDILCEKKARVVMSPQQAMAFSQVLNSAIEKWEREHA